MTHKVTVGSVNNGPGREDVTITVSFTDPGHIHGSTVHVKVVLPKKAGEAPKATGKRAVEAARALIGRLDHDLSEGRYEMMEPLDPAIRSS